MRFGQSFELQPEKKKWEEIHDADIVRRRHNPLSRKYQERRTMKSGKLLAANKQHIIIDF